MSRHILDKADGSEGTERQAKEFARSERQDPDKPVGAKEKALQKARDEPPGDDPRRVGEFVKRDREGGQD